MWETQCTGDSDIYIKMTKPPSLQEEGYETDIS